MRSFSVLLLISGLAVGSALVGCGADPKETTYSGSARNNYLEGMEAFESEDYVEAVRRFTFVKNKYAYSQYAALAELRIADSYFEQDKFVEAIDAYRTFVQGRPNHREVPYAMWRIGLSHYENVPSNFFLFPPAHEKDQAATKDALRALEQYVQRFPEDEHVPRAKEHIRHCRQLLADQELYVASFYLKQDRPSSARGRLERVVSDYPDLEERWSRASLLLARTYLDLGMRDEARAAAERLVQAHPGRPEARDARDLLAELR